MIADLDVALRSTLKGEAQPGSELATVPISFAVPDSDWRMKTNTLALDAYLYELSEDRELRSNQRRVRVQEGVAVVEPPLARLRCSYLITAWNRATAVPGVDLEIKEHRLLSQVGSVLFATPVMPREYLTGLLADPELDLPVVVAEPEGARVPADFWTALDTYVRPAITCRITIPLRAGRAVSGPVMTTARLRVGTEAQRCIVGGIVTDRATAEPVPSAWVRLDELQRETSTDAAGRFRFDGLTPGGYTLAIRAPGYGDGGGPITVPAPSGSYDTTLPPQ